MIKESVISELSSILSNKRIGTSREMLKAYSYDGTTNWISEPDVVVFPSTAEEISAIMKIANTERIPVTPRGAGTCLSGGPVPIKHGIILCTINMKDILDIQKRRLDRHRRAGCSAYGLEHGSWQGWVLFPA